MWYIARASELGAGAAAGSSGAAVSINTRGAITNFGYRPATAALDARAVLTRRLSSRGDARAAAGFCLSPLDFPCISVKNMKIWRALT
jgi:hypothetical protein